MKRAKGFTLIEIIVVIACIALLAGIIAPIAFKNIQNAKIAKAQADVKAIAAAIVEFNKDTGLWPVYDAAGDPEIMLLFSTNDGSTPSWPTNGAPLTDYDPLDNHLVSNDGRYPDWDGYSGWNGTYLEDVRLDPWGTSYLVSVGGFTGKNQMTKVWVVSAGPDKILQWGADWDSLNPLVDDIGIRIK